jgi:hypothetical protein
VNKYLAKLHSLQHGPGAENQKTHDPDEPSKPSKLGFEGFEGDLSMPFFENRGAARVNDRCAERIAEGAKNATPSNPQNPQNLGSASVPATPAVPTMAYRAVSADPAAGGCEVTVIELPAAGRYRKVFAFLQLKCPALVDVARWRQAVEDGSKFLALWGEQAEALGWTSADLFGLAPVPANPHPSYSRLSRYDCTGLCWLLQGREVIALTADTATIRNPRTGNVTVYRKHNKPALGPLGDSLDDLK